MARRAANTDSSLEKSLPPAKTEEGRENQLINLAMKVAETQMKKGTASSQVITHFLKLGSMKEKLEIEKLRHETKLLKARTKAIKDTKRSEEFYKEVIEAMRKYSGYQEDESSD